VQPNEYQKLAERTECDQIKAMMRICPSAHPSDAVAARNVRLLHAVIGLMGELGEVASVLQKWLWYGKPFSDAEIQAKLADEGGDAQWYLAELFNAIQVPMETVMGANIDKLKVRYPEKYTDQKAADESRDRKAEAEAVSLAMVQPVHRPTTNQAKVNPPELTCAQRCDQCRGTGFAKRDRDGTVITEKCPKCGGVGFLGEVGDSHHAERPVPKSVPLPPPPAPPVDPYPPGSTCRYCVGTGRVWIHSHGSAKCLDCGGTGVTPDPTHPPTLPQEGLATPPEGDTGPMS
jgi:hypothetical protein